MVKSLDRDVACKCCGGNKYKIVAMLRHNIYVLKCAKCRLIFVEGLDTALSGKDYFQEYDINSYIKYYKEFRIKTFRKHLGIIEGFISDKGRILDIGCSFGWFLKLAEDSGWQPFGLEPSAEAADYARREYGANILSGDIRSLDSFNLDFKAITLWNTLEHISEPLHTLNMLHKKLSDDGLLIICVPDIDGLIPRISFWAYKASLGRFTFPLEQLYQVNNSQGHLFHFSRHTLTRFLEQSNFEVVKVTKQPILDFKNIKNRIALDKGFAAWPAYAKSYLEIATKALFFLSKISNLEDEIVIYARKNDGSI